MAAMGKTSGRIDLPITTESTVSTLLDAIGKLGLVGHSWGRRGVFLILIVSLAESLMD
jgi:hypothetical protein